MLKLFQNGVFKLLLAASVFLIYDMSLGITSEANTIELMKKHDPLRARPERKEGRRFVSLRSDDVNVRAGPGVRYPIKWKFRQKFIPVKIIQEYDTWRKIRDWEGAEGWVHRAMLSSKRSIIITGKIVILRRRCSDDAPVVARLSNGIVAELKRCTSSCCRVEVGNYDGWLKREDFWGLGAKEILP